MGDKHYLLTPLELKVLRCLSSCQGCVVSQAELLTEVWGCCAQSGGTTNQVRTCVKRLQHKLNWIETDLPYLICVRGHGYRLVSQAEWDEASDA